jgi:outer membrane translocation and assembly module TamA
LFQYLLNRPLRSDFIRNFQVVGFFDAGTAWAGSSPYKKDNSLNIQTVTQGPVTITVVQQIQPVVAGYGFGLRSRLVGYFVRADWAWGVDDKQTQPGIFYLALGLDF